MRKTIGTFTTFMFLNFGGSEVAQAQTEKPLKIQVIGKERTQDIDALDQVAQCLRILFKSGAKLPTHNDLHNDETHVAYIFKHPKIDLTIELNRTFYNTGKSLIGGFTTICFNYQNNPRKCACVAQNELDDCINLVVFPQPPSNF